MPTKGNGKVAYEGEMGHAGSLFLQPGVKALLEVLGGVARTVIEARGFALSRGFGKDDGGGDGDVETLDHAIHGDIKATVGFRAEFAGDAAVFVAHDDGSRPGEIPLAERFCLRAAIRGKNLHVPGAKRGKEVVSVPVTDTFHPFAG